MTDSRLKRRGEVPAPPKGNRSGLPRRPRGRPSRAIERRTEIIDAWLSQVARDGLGTASMAATARLLRVDRTTLHHYFRTYDDLLDAAMEEVIARYRAAADRSGSEEDPNRRGDALLEYAFGPAFVDPVLSRVLLHFSLAASHNPEARRQVRRAYACLEDAVILAVDEDYPDAPKSDRRRIGYAIAQLAEGASVFAELGFAKTRVRAAREAAGILLASLEPQRVRGGAHGA